MQIQLFMLLYCSLTNINSNNSRFEKNVLVKNKFKNFKNAEIMQIYEQKSIINLLVHVNQLINYYNNKVYCLTLVNVLSKYLCKTQLSIFCVYNMKTRIIVLY